VSGDWIKMRGNLWDDPRVARICDLTGTKEATAIGALYWLWATADQHTEDGCMPGLSMQQIDRKTGVKGFAAALVDVGWLADDAQGVALVRFTEHNGKSAKKRLETARRVAKHRAGSGEVTPDEDNGNADSVTDALAREEKRREEVTTAVLVARTTAADASAKRGSRLSSDWALPKAWGEWALQEFPGWTPETVRIEAAKFADFWHAKAGRDAAKLDWCATWRNWCRNAKPQSAPQATTTVPGPQAWKPPPALTAEEIAAADEVRRRVLPALKRVTA
jgi:hypothetical protein